MNSSFLEIDPLHLDREWLNQPSRYFKYAQKLADARRDLDNASAARDVVAADLDRRIRARPAKFGIEKETPTNPEVDAAVEMHAEYRSACTKCNEAQHAVNIYQSAVTALEHRKRALTMLVELRQSEYWAEPTAPSQRSAEHMNDSLQSEVARRTSKKINKKDRRGEE